MDIMLNFMPMNYPKQKRPIKQCVCVCVSGCIRQVNQRESNGYYEAFK